jgi:hypothetical protein
VCVGTVFVPARSFLGRALVFGHTTTFRPSPARAPHFSTTAVQRPNSNLFSSPHACRCRPCTPLPFADQTSLLLTPVPFAAATVHHCCPFNPAIHLKVLLLSWRYCFWISAKLFCWLFSLHFCFGLGSPSISAKLFCWLFSLCFCFGLGSPSMALRSVGLQNCLNSGFLTALLRILSS